MTTTISVITQILNYLLSFGWAIVIVYFLANVVFKLLFGNQDSRQSAKSKVADFLFMLLGMSFFQGIGTYFIGKFKDGFISNALIAYQSSPFYDLFRVYIPMLAGILVIVLICRIFFHFFSYVFVGDKVSVRTKLIYDFGALFFLWAFTGVYGPILTFITSSGDTIRQETIPKDSDPCWRIIPGEACK